MQLIGFNLTKVTAEKQKEFTKPSINTNIQFTDISKEKLDLLKDSEVLKVDFSFEITYHPTDNKEKKQGEVNLHGHLLFSSNKEEAKEITKSWKKKEVPPQYRIPMINYILKRCSTKALNIEEDLNLPSHIPFPQVQNKANSS